MTISNKMKLLREQRRAEGLCVECGGIRSDERYGLCLECRERQRLSYKLRKAPEKKPGNVLSISDVVKLASQRGVSYGEMVHIIEMEGFYK